MQPECLVNNRIKMSERGKRAGVCIVPSAEIVINLVSKLDNLGRI